MSSGDCQVKRRKRSVIKEEEAAASAGGLHPQPAQPLPPSAAVADELLCETRADSPLPVLDVQPKTEPSPIPLAPDREIEGDDDEAYLERIPNYLNRHLWRYVVRPREVIPVRSPPTACSRTPVGSRAVIGRCNWLAGCPGGGA